MLKVNLLGLQAVLSVSGVSFIWRVLKLTLVANKTLDVIYRNIHYLINILLNSGNILSSRQAWMAGQRG